MYIPKAFHEDRREVLHDLIGQYSFGTLVSQREGAVIASHLPLLLDAGRGPEGTLVGHMARANPQWHGFAEGGEVLVIFQGPHAYISPSWYENSLSVPTWDYAAVHAYGTPSLVEDRAALYAILDAMVQTYEAPSSNPWKLELPDDYMSAMMKAIVGFEIRITRLEGKLKLSQNRSLADQRTVADALTQRGDPLSVEVAELMLSTAKREPVAPHTPDD